MIFLGMVMRSVPDPCEAVWRRAREAPVWVVKREEWVRDGKVQAGNLGRVWGLPKVRGGGGGQRVM